MNMEFRDFKKVCEYIYVSFLIHIKAINEYKINLYLGVMTGMTYFISRIIFLMSLSVFIGDLIGWEFKEYVFYLIITNLMGALAGVFYYDRILHRILLTGNFNMFLFRPLNVFLQQLMFSIKIDAFYEGFISFVFLCAGFYYLFDVSLDRFFWFIPFAMCGAVLEVLVGRFCDACAFFMKRDNLMNTLCSEVKHVYYRFPAHIFEGLVRGVSFFVGNVYFGVYSTLFVFGRISYGEFFAVFGILISLIMVFILLLSIIWHYGLKRYEAFG